MKHNKITSGFVIQEYEENEDGFFECVRQVFEAGDPVEYETFSGEPVEVDTDREVYQPFDMVQPEKERVIIVVSDGLIQDIIIPNKANVIVETRDYNIEDTDEDDIILKDENGKEYLQDEWK